MIALRRAHPVFRRNNWFAGHLVGRLRAGLPLPDIAWFTPAGQEMTADDWENGYAKSVAVFLDGDGITARGERGDRLIYDSFLMLFNGHFEQLAFHLPPAEWGIYWELVLDTADAVGGPAVGPYPQQQRWHRRPGASSCCGVPCSRARPRPTDQARSGHARREGGIVTFRTTPYWVPAISAAES